MKKLAIFVEGQTEQIFVEKLLREVAGKNQIAIEIKSQEGRKFAQVIMTDAVTAATKFYVLIYNSGGETRVASDIKDQYNSLTESGYERIIGLRDIYPNKKSDVQRGVNFVLTQINIVIPTNVVLAVMEIEAWFLAEYHHFIEIDASLTLELIHKSFGFNPKTDDMEAISCPHESLHKIYQLVGKAYRKTKNHVERTVLNLNYDFLYMNLANSVPSLGEFIGYIDKFISS
ncbi:DUF4276 family protein [Anabaena azotica]|uniref:DUF4276 family protein n=1 Tax=Anabaena azotica TaxID=197653 RepID=UPI0039A4AEA1